MNSPILMKDSSSDNTSSIFMHYDANVFEKLTQYI